MKASTFIKNKILIYLATRYLTYALQFVLSLIVAVRLGPYYLGVYGLILLIISYFEQVNFGIPHSLNVLLVQNKHDRKIQDDYTLNSIAFFTFINIVSITVTICLWRIGGIQWGEYYIDKYLIIIVLTAICNYYNSLFTMVVRFRNKVNVLSIISTIPVLCNFLILFFYNGESLVYALLLSTLAANLISFLIFYFEGAVPRIKITSLSLACQSVLIKKGFFLFLYNSCFYFILIGVRTLVSINYCVEEFGYFTFSFTLANAVMLLLGSINTIIFPKTLDMMASGDVLDTKNAVEKLRVGYITTANLLIFFAMICFPFVTRIFPKYQEALTSMNLIALAVLMNVYSYGYTSLLIAKNKEKLTSFISLTAFILSMALGCILVYVVHIQFSYVVISVMLGYLVFSLLSYYYGNKELFGETSIKHAFLNFFPAKYSLPYIVALLISIFQIEAVIWLPFVLFLILNLKDISYLFYLVVRLVTNPNIIDVK